ncbi:MAG TPA: TlpA disulfide reductase family protein [Pirellulales bacterium]|nr:TlpA disulfide reductase family protein [Pirellulales bacterium]
MRFSLAAAITAAVCLCARAVDADETRGLVVRGTTVDELVAFIQQAKEQRPAESPAADMARRTAQQRSIVVAADRILALEPDDASATRAWEEKLDALWQLVTFGADGAAGELREAAETMQDDPHRGVSRRAAFLLSWYRADQLRAIKDPAARQQEAVQIMAEVGKQLARADTDPRLITLAAKLPEDLEPLSPRLALQASVDFGAALGQRDDVRSRRAADHLAGLAKRWQMLGQPVRLVGELHGGGRFNPDTLRDHVVLVDFWATWCAPCVAELPALKGLAARFGDRGLKVVGVSLDEDRERLADFVAEQRLAWPILCDPPLAGGTSHALADQLGVKTIPMMILIGRDGRVLRLGTRVADFADQIEALLATADADALPQKPQR